MQIIVFAIPLFFLLMGIELIMIRLGATGEYRLNDAISNISCGIVQQVIGVLLKAFLVSTYIYIFETLEWHIFRIPTNIWTGLILFVVIDFIYYWFHRYSHEISFLWGAHVVHHQSEEYNLSVALRQSAFQQLFSWFFYLPLVFIGFHPALVLTVNLLQTLYQFWIHTESIRKMGFLEWFMNTPSHHRVHHGINPKYIDKNHAGTFIIWDRMFGTFEPEVEEVVYGTVKPLNTWDPIWANFDYYKQTFITMKSIKGVGNKLLVWVKKPGWRPKDQGGQLIVPEVTRAERPKYKTSSKPGLNVYILFQFGLMIVGATAWLANTNFMGYGVQLISSSLILASVFSLAGLFEKRPGALLLEYFRLLLIPIIVIYFFYNGGQAYIMLGALGLIALVSMIWLSAYAKDFFTVNSTEETNEV